MRRAFAATLVLAIAAPAAAYKPGSPPDLAADCTVTLEVVPANRLEVDRRKPRCSSRAS